MSDILIIGKGTVGINLGNELAALKPDFYDKYKGIDERIKGKYDIAFICVDTPRTEDTFCDCSELEVALAENDAEVFVIKSTLLPLHLGRLRIEWDNKHIVYSPEYYGSTQHCNNYNFNFTILGGDKEDCKKVIQVLQNVYDASHQFKITDAMTASLVKYMENAYLATKVSFCNQFFDIAEQVGVDYEELRELFILDPRVNPSHTFVYRDHPYWDSHCLNKDVSAIAAMYDAEFLKYVVDWNWKRRGH